MIKSSNLGISFIGSGAATSTQILDNQGLAQLVDTSDDWITTRTGMKERHLINSSESLCSLSTKASLNALEMAGIKAEDLDLIILATSTPDDLFGTANQIQLELGASNAVAFDLTAACSGFVFALVTAAQFMRNGLYKNVLVIGGDILSRWVDWSDRTTCVLFGDGAGAVVLQSSAEERFLSFEIRSDGSQNACLNLPYKGEEKTLINGVTITQGNYQPISMNGKEVYRFAVSKVPEIIDKVLYKAELTVNDIDWLVLHQANQRILAAVGDRLNIPSDKIISNLAQYGNTSAASIPIALDEAIRSGKIQVGDTIATAGFGAGLTWGGAIFKWGK
jgi:3-oxoacyl-[acyl-carrier-protein] synthase III